MTKKITMDTKPSKCSSPYFYRITKEFHIPEKQCYQFERIITVQKIMRRHIIINIILQHYTIIFSKLS